MKRDKIVGLLSQMDSYEQNRFRKFICSPYFCDNEDIIQFFDALIPFIRKEEATIARKKVWRKAFGNKTYQTQKYRRLASDLTQLGYRFLSLEWHERDHELSQYRGILHKTNTASLSKHYKTALRNMRKALNERGFRDADYFLYKYYSEHESHLHLQHTNATRTTLSNLKAADQSLDIFYALNKLRHYCDALNYNTFLSIPIQVNIPPRFFEILEEHGLLEIPAIHIYYLISKTITEPEESHYYYQLIELLELHYSLFPKAELEQLYIYATNYCIRQINLGNLEYFRVLYELYFTLLKRKTIFNAVGELDERHYKNIISIGLRLEEYDSVEQFIKAYSPKLEKDVRENALTYNLAHLYYAKKEYDKVIEQLRYVEYKDIFYALGSRFMLLKTYYETKEYKAFEAQVDSFQIYLRRNKVISTDLKTQYLNCLKFIKKIHNTPIYEKEQFQKMKEKINNNPKIVNKQWLNEKLDEILKRR